MRIWTKYLFLIISAIWLQLNPLLGQSGQVSEMWPDGDVLEFGSFSERGVERLDTLALYNPTEAPFVIENIRPSCGCTAVKWPQEPIEPGTTAKIPVAFRCTKGGAVERHLDIYLSHQRKKERIYVYADCPLR